MHDTPEIEDEAVIPRCNLPHAADDANGHDAPLVPTETCGTLAWSAPTASGHRALTGRASVVQLDGNRLVRWLRSSVRRERIVAQRSCVRATRRMRAAYCFGYIAKSIRQEEPG